MTVAEITAKMITFSKGSQHDICHFLKVFAYAQTIAKLEGVDEKTLKTIEIAALVHDIACPPLRLKFGNAPGKEQEREGGPMARAFLSDCELDEEMLERVVFLVAHHHTLKNIEGIDWQILVEADYLVNAYESGYSKTNIEHTRDTIFKTKAGINLLNSAFLI